MHYNALPIYQLEFQKFCFIKKILENCRYLVKTTFAVYLIIFKLIFSKLRSNLKFMKHLNCHLIGSDKSNLLRKSHFLLKSVFQTFFIL